MAVCSKCLKRLIIWVVLTVSSIIFGLVLDLHVVKSKSFPILFRIIGFTGVFFIHFLLKRTGRLLKEYGDCERWGWSTRLIISDVYHCVRHPHHLAVGLFMTFFGLLIGYPITFFIIAISQWVWVFLFVIFIEEYECMEKFGPEYLHYKKNVPMLFCNPVCIVKEFIKGKK